MELKIVKIYILWHINKLLIAPLMELKKLIDGKTAFHYFGLLIAPLMELKIDSSMGVLLLCIPFNRTAYGIEKSE